MRIGWLLLSPLLAFMASAQPSGPEWNVLYGHPDFEGAERMVSDHLRKLTAALSSERDKVISGLKTPGDLEQYQRTVRARLRQALGDFPERTPLNALLTGTLERDGYRVEKVIFESRPRYYVTANVYVPARARAPFPAVICPVGHWGAGKAYEDYQRLGIYLARRGILALVYDVPGQGERLQYYNTVLERSLIDPGGSVFFVTIEHGLGGAQSILTSGTYAPYLLWDGIRALDYLSERRDVDKEKLACTGTSGGGLQTELLSALDQRIKVSIPVCYGGCAPDTPMSRDFNMTDVDALIAPRPLLMIEATGDSRSGVLAKQRRHQVVSHAYKAGGADERTRYVIMDGPHGYGENMRQQAYLWLARWFDLPSTRSHTLDEPPTAIEPESELSCTTTGQVKTALGGDTIASLNRQQASSAPLSPPEARAGLESWRQAIKQEVASRTGASAGSTPLQARQLARLEGRRYDLEKIVYFSEPEIFIPGLLLLPKAKGPKPAVLFVPESGNGEALAETYLAPLVEAGHVVLSIDVRGVGETKPADNAQKNYRGHTHGPESNLFYDALRAGTTILGLRTRDVLRGIDYLRSRPEVDHNRLSAIGQGLGGLLVLHAAALDDRIGSAVVSGSLISYGSIRDHELYTHPFSAFVPGALQRYDLPELAAAIAPRSLLLLNLVDHVHQRVSPEQVATTYRRAAQVYRLLEAEPALRMATANSPQQIVRAYLNLLQRR